MSALSIVINVLVKLHVLVIVATFGPTLVEKDATNTITIKRVPHVYIFLNLGGLVRQVA